MGSLLLDQRSNPHPLPWKHRVLATELPRKPHKKKKKKFKCLISCVLPSDSAVQNLLAMQVTPVHFLGPEDSPGGGSGNPRIFLPGESHGQRSLAGYSPRGCKESDVTDRLSRPSALTEAHLFHASKVSKPAWLP